MPKKSSTEGKILDYFENISLPEARVMFNVLQTRLKQREAAESGTRGPVAVVKRRTKAEMAAARTAAAAPGTPAATEAEPIDLTA